MNGWPDGRREERMDVYMDIHMSVRIYDAYRYVCWCVDEIIHAMISHYQVWTWA